MTDSMVTTVEEAEGRAALTPSEVALARVLAAVEEWARGEGHDGSKSARVLSVMCGPLIDYGFMYAGTGQSTDAGRALLARARKAGVL